MGEKIRERYLFQTFLFFILIQFVAFVALATPGEGHRYFDEGDESLLSGDYDKAVSNYLKGMNYAKKKYISKIWDDLGYAYLQQGKYENAITYLKDSISAFPENYNPRLYLAASYISTNNVQLASQELDIIENNIYLDETWLSDAKNILLINEYGDKISKDELYILRKERGVYFHKNSKDSDSRIQAVLYIDAFNEANEGVLHFMRGFIYKKLDDYKKAEDKFLEALALGYDEPELWLELRDLYLKTDRQNKAQKISEHSKKFKKKDEKISFKIQHRLKDHENSLLWSKFHQSLNEIQNGKIKESIKTLEDALMIKEKSYVINHNLALLYFDEFELDPKKKDKLEKAEIYCARSLWFIKYQTGNKKHIIGCYDLMANIYSLKMEWNRSLNEFKKILEIDSKNAHAHYNLGFAYFNIKDFQSEENAWLNAIELEKKTQNQREDKQNQREDKGVPGGKKEHSVTVRKRSISFMAHQALGNLYLKQQQIGKAISRLKTAISINTSAADPHLLLAKSYQKIGAKEKAIFHLEKYIYLGGKNEKEAKELLRQLKR